VALDNWAVQKASLNKNICHRVSWIEDTTGVDARKRNNPIFISSIGVL